jgi:uncharacterized Zn finger protein
MVVEFGATPWGRAWVRTIESTGIAAPNPLLPNARSLARNNAVSLTAAAGRIDAEVTASGKAHRVLIDLPLWSEREQAVVEPLIAKALADHRGLAAGDLPDTLATDLRREHVDIAVPADQQAAECDCRTRRRPCVHILATIYALAQRIDEHPALAVGLRSSGGEPAGPADPDWIALADIDAATFYCD